MTDRLWFAIAATIAGAMIGFAAVWPQGFGARSPGPFGHAPIVRPAAAPAPSQAAKLDLDAPSSAVPAAAGLRPTE